MKLPVATLLVLLCLSRSVSAHPQVEHLKESYKAQGDALFVPLYWLPETHPTILRHFPHLESSVDFEHGFWKQVAESDKLKLMEELGQEFERMESPRLDATWARIRDWHSHRFFSPAMPLRVLQFVFAFHFVAGGELGAGALGTEARSLILPPAKAPVVFGSVRENGPLYPREPRYNPAYTKLPRYRLKQTREIRAMVCRHRRDNWPFFQQ